MWNKENTPDLYIVFMKLNEIYSKYALFANKKPAKKKRNLRGGFWLACCKIKLTKYLYNRFEVKYRKFKVIF